MCCNAATPCDQQEEPSTDPTAARTAPSVDRNRGPILQVLREILPADGLALEIASGTGEHAVWFSRALPHLLWQPTDRDPEAIASIAEWRRQAGPPNLLPPLLLDASQPETWPVLQAAAIVVVNMLHIAPWIATEGLIAGAALTLPKDGALYLYGPFREAATPLAPSNLAFDLDLKARNPAWGLRELGDITALAARHGMTLDRRIAMPANNLSVALRRR